MSLAQRALDADGTDRELQRLARAYLIRARAMAIRYGRPNMANRLQLVHGKRPGIKAKRGLKRPYYRVQARLSEDELIADSRTARATERQILRMAKRG